MNKLIEFNVPNGSVVVESQDGAVGSIVRGAGLGPVTEKVGKSLLDALSVIRPVAEAALGACSKLDVLPETVEVQFGVKFDVHIGAVIACANTEGNLHIKLVWKPT